MYFHVLLHFLLAMLLLWDIDYHLPVAAIAISHYFIDLAKLYTTPLFKLKSIPFFIDQALHILILYVVAYQSDLWSHTQMLIGQINWSLVTALVFVTFPSSIIMGKLLEAMSDKIELDHKSYQMRESTLASLSGYSF